MSDVPTTVLGHVTDGCEQTTRLWALEVWRWPTTDPDERRADVVADARAALRRTDEPTLPILEPVLAGLRMLTR